MENGLTSKLVYIYEIAGLGYFGGKEQIDVRIGVDENGLRWQFNANGTWTAIPVGAYRRGGMYPKWELPK